MTVEYFIEIKPANYLGIFSTIYSCSWYQKQRKTKLDLENAPKMIFLSNFNKNIKVLHLSGVEIVPKKLSIYENLRKITKVQLFHASNVTSTSQYQVFVEKFDQEPKKVRIKMADLTGP